MSHPQIPDDITQVTEAELREKLSTLIDSVAYQEAELVVVRDGKPIAAVISMDGWRALRPVAEGVVEQITITTSCFAPPEAVTSSRTV